MLSLESPVWKTLRHAYGFAHDVPGMLRALKTHPTKKAWEDIYSSLCHQGDVYPASYAAVPHIVDMALEAPQERQIDYWCFVGAIATHGRLEESLREDLRAPYVDALNRSVGPIRRLLESKPKDRSEVVYLLAALAASVGCKGEAAMLDYLDSNEMPGRCPACSIELLLTVESDGIFLAPQDNLGLFTTVLPPDTEAIPKSVPDQLDREAVSTWLPSMAVAAGQPELASTIKTLYGKGSCPACDAPFKVLEEFGRQASPP